LNCNLRPSIKPGALNRGRGIEVFSSVGDIEAYLGSVEYGSAWIIQKYIEAGRCSLTPGSPCMLSTLETKT